MKEAITGMPAGWSDDIRLTNEITEDVSPTINVNGNTVDLVWEKDTTGAGGHYDIFYINSTDAGNSWNNPILLTGNVSGIYARRPDIGVNDSNIHIIWDSNDAVGREVKYRNSTDGGITWSNTKMISADDGEYSESAKIGINGSELHVVWVDQRHKAESLPWNTELYYVRSLDGGITWDDGLGNVGQERRLTNALYESYGGQYGLSVEGDAIHLVWGDARNGVTTGEIYYKRSLDKGATWEDGLGNIDQDRLLTTNLTNSHGLPTIATYGATIHAAWVDTVWPGPNYYIYYRNSSDNGATWGPIKLLVDSGTAFNPSLDAMGNEVHLTWDDWRDNGSTKEIYYKNSTDGGTTWGAELRLTEDDGNSSAGPIISISGSQRHIIWQDQRDGNREIYYKRFPDFPDTSPPDINHIPIPSANIGQTINITANITDDVGVNAVYLDYTGVNATNYNVSMNQWNGNYSYDIPGQASAGFLDYFIWANDTSGNDNQTIVHNVQIYDSNDIEIDSIPYIINPGWNIISIPMEPLDKGLDGKFTAFDLIREIEDDLGYNAFVLARFDGGMPDRYTIFDAGTPNGAPNDFDITYTEGYWLYSPGPVGLINIRSQNISNWGVDNVRQLRTGWNLLGFPHNYSVGGTEPGGWNVQLKAHHFTDGTVDPDLITGGPAGDQIIATMWYANVQQYMSYVDSTIFPGIQSKDWTYDADFAYGYWVWVNNSVEVTFDTEF